MAGRAFSVVPWYKYFGGTNRFQAKPPDDVLKEAVEDVVKLAVDEVTGGVKG
jgi:hypothetical protein